MEHNGSAGGKARIRLLHPRRQPRGRNSAHLPYAGAADRTPPRIIEEEAAAQQPVADPLPQPALRSAFSNGSRRRTKALHTAVRTFKLNILGLGLPMILLEILLRCAADRADFWRAITLTDVAADGTAPVARLRHDRLREDLSPRALDLALRGEDFAFAALVFAFAAVLGLDFGFGFGLLASGFVLPGLPFARLGGAALCFLAALTALFLEGFAAVFAATG